MRRLPALLVAVPLVVMAGCSSDDGTPESSSTKAAAVPPPTRPTPAPQATYVPAPGDPKTHRLHVTIRDMGRSYTPGSCAAIHGEPDSDGFYGPDRLGFEGPDKTYELRPLGKEFPIPKQGTARPDGTCEATMDVTVPFAPRYRAGIAILGQGIADPRNPGPNETWIVTTGSSQDVVVINYPGSS